MGPRRASGVGRCPIRSCSTPNSSAPASRCSSSTTSIWSSNPDGYRYTQFCEHYKRWCQDRRLSMRQIHRAGEKLFVDYSGKKPEIVDPATGEVREVELFVAVLGASNFTYAEATATQQIGDWVQSHVRAFEYLGGIPGAVVPDQLKTGVTRACRYEPELQRCYEELALHYGTVILPARPAKARDKRQASYCSSFRLCDAHWG